MEATKIIRSQISATVPIIALTANVVKGEKERCISAGMNEFIGKPFDETMLIKSIARLTNRSLVAVEDKANTPVPEKEESLYDLSKLWDISRGK
ncbi:response regulator, partial [Mycobacterium tuberculosis]